MAISHGLAVAVLWASVQSCMGAALSQEPFCPAHVQFSAASRVHLPEGWGVKPPCSGDACIEPNRLIDVPDGWAAVIEPRKLPLWGAGFSYGPPEDQAQLKPDIRVRKGISYATNTFEDGTAPHHGYWLDCVYGDGVVHLSRRISDHLKECTVISPPASRGEPSRVSMTCK